MSDWLFNKGINQNNPPGTEILFIAKCANPTNFKEPFTVA